MARRRFIRYSTSISLTARLSSRSSEARISPFSATRHKPENTLSVLLSPLPGAAITMPQWSRRDRKRMFSSASSVELTVSGKEAIWAITVAPERAWQRAGGVTASISAPSSTATDRPGSSWFSNSISVKRVTLSPPMITSTASSSGTAKWLPST